MNPFFWTSFWEKVYAVPFHYLEMLFAFLAAMAFLLFLRGFIGGIGNLFKIDAHREHIEHARTRAVWGVMFLGVLFVAWEVVRTIASWFGFRDGGQSSLGYWFVGAIIIISAFLFVKKELFSGGGH